MANARSAKERYRLEGEPPTYPPGLSELRREIIVIDHDHGRVEHHIKLYRSNRVDCYVVEVDGQKIPVRMGWARVIEMTRKAFVRVRNISD